MIAKNPKVIMNEKQFVDRLMILANRRTYYKNKYPDNLCYIHADERTSADCVNLIKAVLNGYNVYNTMPGYYQKDLSNTGDCTEAELICQCTDISEDFRELDSHPRILWMQGHVGVYLGREMEHNGYIVNVIECTAAWGGGILYSYVSSDGKRYESKGGRMNCVWKKHGLPSKWVDQSEQNAEPTTTKKTYFVKKGDTMSSIAKANGMSLQELASLNPQIKDLNKIYVGQVIYLANKEPEEYYIVKKGDTLSAIAKQFNINLSKLLGLNPDIKNPNLIHVGDKIRVK